MVFESVLAYFIDKYLSDYIENIDTSKLSVAVWSGDVVLENLKLKANALDELDLPFAIVHGHLNKLKLTIPWNALYTKSVKVLVDGLTILVVPKSSVKYDSAKDEKSNSEQKLNEVRRLLELEKANKKGKAFMGNQDVTGYVNC
jgi:vacuolar protein sorting-associated protein 13A/C